MAPPLLILRNINLTFGGTPLFEGAEFSVSERRTALPCWPQWVGQINPAEDRGRHG